MLKRLTWFVGGAAAGVAGATVARRKVVKTAAQLPPVKAVKRVVSTVQEAGERVAGAARDGRSAMRETEARLRAKRSGEEVAPIEVVDGRIVATGDIKPGQVIVLREVAAQRANRQTLASAERPRRAKR